MVAADVSEIRTISSHPSRHGWPTVTRLTNGELWVAVSAGREQHVCPFGQVHLIKSADDGATWTQELLVNGPLDDRDGGIIQTRKGTIIVNWFTSVAWLNTLKNLESNPEARQGKEAFLSRCQKIKSLMSDELIERELSPWLIRSEDGGKTWSDKINPLVGTPHGPTELSDGRLLYPGEVKRTTSCPSSGSPYDPRIGLSESRDDGHTWSYLADVPHRACDEAKDYVEPHLVEAANGSLVMHIRHQGATDHWNILQSESTDGGASWSIPHTTGLWGQPAHLLRLRDGRLLTTYGYRRDPYGNRAAISGDHGKTWSHPMIISAEERRRDCGYPSTVEMPDGSFLTVWYESMRGDESTVRMGRWCLRD